MYYSLLSTVLILFSSLHALEQNKEFIDLLKDFNNLTKEAKKHLTRFKSFENYRPIKIANTPVKTANTHKQAWTDEESEKNISDFEEPQESEYTLSQSSTFENKLNNPEKSSDQIKQTSESQNSNLLDIQLEASSLSERLKPKKVFSTVDSLGSPWVNGIWLGCLFPLYLKASKQSPTKPKQFFCLSAFRSPEKKIYVEWHNYYTALLCGSPDGPIKNMLTDHYKQFMQRNKSEFHKIAPDAPVIHRDPSTQLYVIYNHNLNTIALASHCYLIDKMVLEKLLEQDLNKDLPITVHPTQPGEQEHSHTFVKTK